MQKTKNSKPSEAAGKSRRCLMCGQNFPSEGQHNHICKRCKGTQAWRDGVATRNLAS